jgi:hypothetical protein
MLRNRLIIDVGRKIDVRALLAAGLLQAATPPFDVAWLDAVLVVQNAAHPHIGRHLVLGKAERLSLEVLRARNSAVGADVDRAMPEQAGHECRDGDVMRFTAGRGQHVAAHGNLADIEFLEFEGAVKGFLRLERDRRDVAAFDRGASIENRARAVVITDGQAQLQRHMMLHARDAESAGRED